MLRIDARIYDVEPVFNDLYRISLQDDEIGDEGVDDGGTALVTYSQSKSGFGPNMLNYIINEYTAAVFVSGVESDYLVWDGESFFGTPITEYSGVCFRPDLFGNMEVFYDLEENYGDGYFVYDVDGERICNPSFIILAHELSHALHWADGTIDEDNPELQAITDENNVRTEHNIVNRDPLNHEGGLGGVECLSADPSEPSPDTEIWWSCFIVSAAYSSSNSSQVRKLQQLRKVYSQQSPLFGQFILQLREEYYRFSPKIAEAMKNSDELKKYISELIVDPLLFYVTILDYYFNLNDGQEISLSKVDSALREQLLMRSSHSITGKAETVYQELLKLKSHFAQHSNEPVTPPSPPTTMSTADVLFYFFDSMKSSNSLTIGLEWALVQPLVIYWSTLTRLEEVPQETARGGEYWFSEIKTWIMKIPVPPELISQLNEEELIAELNSPLLSNPLLRDVVCPRVLQECNHIIPYYSI